jgi:dTDP-glucose 4,6-dehydratase
LLSANSDKAIGRTINLGSGRGISIRELAELIIKVTNKKVEISSDEERIRPPNSEVEKLIADNTLAKNLLGWKPRISLEEGLKRTSDWVEANLERYRPYIYER